MELVEPSRGVGSAQTAKELQDLPEGVGVMRVKSVARVSIALATYNGAVYLPEMLDSYAQQTHPPMEIVVSDDHSKDGTLDVLSSYQPRLPLLVCTNPGKGIVANFENAIRGCTGDYVALSDQDDVWLDHKIEKLLVGMRVLETFFGAQTPILVFSDLEIVDQTLETISPSFFASSIKKPMTRGLQPYLLGNHVPGCTFLFNRALLDRAMPLTGVMTHDWWLILVALGLGKVGYVDRPLIKYRQHGSNAVGLGGFGKSKLNVLLHPWRFFEKRLEQMRGYRSAINGNIAEFIRRYHHQLRPEDQGLVDELARRGGFLRKLLRLGGGNSGVRAIDQILLCWLLRDGVSLGNDPA